MTISTMNISKTKPYFEENAHSWIMDAYNNTGYNYPVGFHRVRIVKEIIKALKNVKRLIDVGCGGGHLALTLAEQGYEVLGIDQSSPMIDFANQNKKNLPSIGQKKLTFKQCSLDEAAAADTSSFDALTAMGLIGYLNEDGILFNAANKILRDQGYLIVSFRNRLFNLYSLSHRTMHEIENNNFGRLANEITELCNTIDRQSIKSVIENLYCVTKKILEEGLLDKSSEHSAIEATEEPSYTFNIEARQTTPKEAIQTAKECGFRALKLYGVHPHLTIPRLNKLLPPEIYNLLSDSLIPLEKDPMSLAWSSVFIGVFQKDQ